jgi:hypothetical protein
LPSIAFWTRTLTSSPHSSQSPCQTSYEISLTSNSQHSCSSLRPQMHRHQTDSMLMGSLPKPGKLLEQMLQWLAEAGTVTDLQQTTSWWPVGNGWTKLCHRCQTDIKACCLPAYKVRIWPSGWVLLQHQLCQPDSWRCLLLSSTFAALRLNDISQNGLFVGSLYHCMKVLILNGLWALLVGFAEQQLCNATPAMTFAVQSIAEGSAVASAKSHASLMHTTVESHRPCSIAVCCS